MRAHVDKRRANIKIVLDVTRLVQEGKLTRDEAERLKSLASHDTSTLAISALMVFGAAAVSAGILALNPSFAAGAALGVAFVLVGLAVTFRGSAEWSLLGMATVIIGALLLSGGVIGLFEGALVGTCFAAALLFVLAALIRSSFLMVLVPLAVAGALGSSTGYTHATYMLIVREPAITILVFSVLAAAAYLVSLQVRPVYERLALVFARMSLLLVNFGFWVGSLWGDYPGQSWLRGGTYSESESSQTWRAAAWHIRSSGSAPGHGHYPRWPYGRCVCRGIVALQRRPGRRGFPAIGGLGHRREWRGECSGVSA
ncbi:MAG: hypothetical protein E6G83_07720 [Alphaproteobacteria bacterium]|nr:MAG: hypothetical protein E6G83_07720 [Alphaproteobacteria bacterium]